MKSFDNITVFTNEDITYNIYGINEINSFDITLSEEHRLADELYNFNFAVGFAAALLNYCNLTDVFITEVHTYHNIWTDDKDPDPVEKIIWSGSIKVDENS